MPEAAVIRYQEVQQYLQQEVSGVTFYIDIRHTYSYSYTESMLILHPSIIVSREILRQSSAVINYETEIHYYYYYYGYIAHTRYRGSSLKKTGGRS